MSREVLTIPCLHLQLEYEISQCRNQLEEMIGRLPPADHHPLLPNAILLAVAIDARLKRIADRLAGNDN